MERHCSYAGIWHNRKAGKIMLYVKDLYKSYQVGRVKYSVLKGIGFHVAQGEFVAVMGPSGSGKTTLLNCISCYIPFDDGSIMVGGVKLAGQDEDALAKIRNTKLGFVFQDFMLLDGLTIRENILVPRIVQGKVEKDAEQLAARLADMFGIGHILDKYPAEVSGGEKQKMLFARTLYLDTPVVILDEPTAALDPIAENELYLNYGKAMKNRTGIYISHRLSSTRFCDRILLLEHGKIVEEGTHDSLLAGKTRYAELFEVQSRYYKDEDERKRKSELMGDAYQVKEGEGRGIFDE